MRLCTIGILLVSLVSPAFSCEDENEATAEISKEEMAEKRAEEGHKILQETLKMQSEGKMDNLNLNPLTSQ